MASESRRFEISDWMGLYQVKERDWRDIANYILFAEMSLSERALEVQRRNAEIEFGVRPGELITTLDHYGGVGERTIQCTSYVPPQIKQTMTGTSICSQSLPRS